MFRFLIKSVFWISLAFLVMPHLMGDDENKFFSTSSSDKLIENSSSQLVKLHEAQKSMSELEQLCKNFSQYCDEDKTFFSAVLSTTLNGAGQFLDFLSTQFSQEETSVDTILRDEIEQ